MGEAGVILAPAFCFLRQPFPNPVRRASGELRGLTRGRSRTVDPGIAFWSLSLGSGRNPAPRSLLRRAKNRENKPCQESRD
jgi:hypothetical protein